MSLGLEHARQTALFPTWYLHLYVFLLCTILWSVFFSYVSFIGANLSKLTLCFLSHDLGPTQSVPRRDVHGDSPCDFLHFQRPIRRRRPRACEGMCVFAPATCTVYPKGSISFMRMFRSSFFFSLFSFHVCVAFFLLSRLFSSSSPFLVPFYEYHKYKNTARSGYMILFSALYKFLELTR